MKVVIRLTERKHYIKKGLNYKIVICFGRKCLNCLNFEKRLLCFQYGNTLTNIVVVQYSELVQTSRDLIYNLTCTLQAPGETLVTSGYIGAG